jgi:uncharacterized protein
MWYSYEVNTMTVSVYVQPGAKSTEIAGLHDGMLKIRLNSQPIDGCANDALQRYIAQLFGVPVRQVTLVRGEKSRRKTLRIVGSAVDPKGLL